MSSNVDDWGGSDNHDMQILLARVAMIKDGTTAEHITRMAYIAERIGEQYGLTARQLDSLLHAAPLHDIGKIGIPDEILKKPGALTPDELKIMRTHARLGYELLTLTGQASLALGAEIALCHHERWDGQGYPQGMHGTSIPLSARIVAIADVFDALTSVRPYKAAWSVEAAMEHIRSLSGKHFDPDLVDCLETALHDVEHVVQVLTSRSPMLPGLAGESGFIAERGVRGGT